MESVWSRRAGWLKYKIYPSNAMEDMNQPKNKYHFENEKAISTSIVVVTGHASFLLITGDCFYLFL